MIPSIYHCVFIAWYVILTLCTILLLVGTSFKNNFFETINEDFHKYPWKKQKEKQHTYCCQSYSHFISVAIYIWGYRELISCICHHMKGYFELFFYTLGVQIYVQKICSHLLDFTQILSANFIQNEYPVKSGFSYLSYRNPPSKICLVFSMIYIYIYSDEMVVL